MFELANPWILLITCLPLIYWLIMPRAKIKLSSAVRVPFFAAMLSIANQEKRSVTAQFSLLLPILIWLLLVFSLAGPRWIGEPKPIEREGYNLMLALDLSGSMEIPDMVLNGRSASRLAVVKRAAEEFVRDRSGDKIGLILFGSQAYLQTPLTYDRRTVLSRLDDATVGLAGKTTSIGDAVGLAVKRLDNVPKKGRVIILLTDGVNNSGVLEPLKAAELAKDEGIKIYTIGLGAESSNNGFFMPNINNDLDEKTLKAMSAMTDGRYFRATDTETLHSIYKTINKLEKEPQEQTTVRPQTDYYPWFTGLALFLYLYWLAEKAQIHVKIKAFISRRKELNA